MNNDLVKWQSFINTTAQNISEFLLGYVGNIENYYDWDFDQDKVPSAIRFDYNTLPDWYHKTIQLKSLLIDELQKCDSFEDRYVLGKYFVVTWGQVGNNKDLKKVLAKYDQVEDLTNINTMTGISSWSKYLSLRNSEAAIYDSRVGYAINTINYLQGFINNFFPIPGGRSPKLKLLDIETLFLLSKLKENDFTVSREDKEHRQIAKRIKKKYYVPHDITYRAYLELLNKVALNLNLKKNDKHKIEMLLFALAPGAIFEALIDKQSQRRN